MADAFDVEQSPVDLPADLLQVGQIGQPFVDSKIMGVAESPFGPATAPFFEVLLQIEVLVVDMQARVHAVLNHPGSKLSRRFLRHHPVEDQLHAIRAAQIQVVADDFLEELAAPQRPVENLCQADFHLPDREIPVVTRTPVFRPERKRNAAQPFPEHPVNVFRPQRVADLLQLHWLGAGKESVVQRFVGDVALVELSLGPFVPVQTQLHTPRRVAADLEKQRAELFVIDVEIVVIDVDRLVAVELELPVDLVAVEGLRFLLRYPNENDGVSHVAAAPEAVGNIVLPLFVPELIHRNAFLFGQRLHSFAKLLRDLPQNNGRGNRLPQLIPHEEDQARPGRQLADVTVQVQTVETLHFESHMAVEQFRDGRHPTNSMRMPGFPLVGLRSKTSLARGAAQGGHELRSPHLPRAEAYL